MRNHCWRVICSCSAARAERTRSILPEPIIGSGCDGSFPRVENNRFIVTTTVYALMTWAYSFNRNGGCGSIDLKSTETRSVLESCCGGCTGSNVPFLGTYAS